ncbi:MAG: BolA family protein [Myxococcales bacterium]|nr:BolA family transcriptional regulator [Polyangiaceae bacterium]MDW8249482.1 BolA family protein [Myxococcales bacterium]
MIEPSELHRMLQEAFPDADIQIEDLTGSRDHYRAVVISGAFEGKGLIERHRAVYAALGDAMKTRIHALTLETKTPAEHSRRLT